MIIPFVNLKAQFNPFIERAIHNVIRSGRFILGPEVNSVEKEIAAYCGAKYAAGAASGTDALLLSLISCGIGPGDEVITTPFTFIATTESIIRCGARPVFVDIDPRTYNIDAEKILPAITKKTKAILPVHLFGHSCDMDPIMQTAKRHKLKVIEDCAQAMGSLYKNRHVGSIGDSGCLSFFPTKNLGCFGDGGMVITNSKKIAEKVRILRNHGAMKKYHYVADGFNSRLDSIQAAVLRIKLKHLDKWIKKRGEIAALYTKLLTGVIPPYTAPYTRHSFNYYTIRVPNRDKVQKLLAKNGISTEIYYPICLHKKRRALFFSEKYKDEVLSLPVYPGLTEKEIVRICKLINEAV